MTRLVFIALLSITLSFATGQTLQQKLQSGMPINAQFETLLNQSRSQDADFKIIRRSNVQIIQKNINDSLNFYKKELAKLQQSSSGSMSELKNVKDSIAQLSTALQTEQAKTDSISFLGIDFNKGSYHTLVWSIIAVVSVALFITLASFRKAKVDAKEHQTTMEEAQHELQVFKKKAMEKEQLLKRQLLDEQLKRNS